MAPRPPPPSSQSALETEALTPRRRAHASVRRFRLDVVGGQDAGKSIVSSAERLVVGTHRSADLQLTDRAVSRFHCEVALLEGKAILRELGSRNGTSVDGVEVIAAPLRDGAALAIGQTRVRFELGSDHVRIPLSERAWFGDVVGPSSAMRAVFATLERVAPTDLTVLLLGESGTGKELVAEAIHRASPRAAAPFVVVDCGSLPPGLVESELFGHVRGAFTGAGEARPGAFELADGGTLFLDEVGELEPEVQPKLLRVLEQREIRRVGDGRVRPLDIRVIAATNRDPRREVNTKRLRADLYYRLAVAEVVLPPLRERREDIRLLSEVLLRRLAPGDPTLPGRVLGPELLARLERHDWPGNVRELRNYLQRCLLLEDPAQAPAPGAHGRAGERGALEIDTTVPLREAREALVEAAERRYLERILERHGGNVTAAARAAGINRVHLYRLLWRAGLR